MGATPAKGFSPGPLPTRTMRGAKVGQSGEAMVKELTKLYGHPITCTELRFHHHSEPEYQFIQRTLLKLTGHKWIRYHWHPADGPISVYVIDLSDAGITTQPVLAVFPDFDSIPSTSPTTGSQGTRKEKSKKISLSLSNSLRVPSRKLDIVIPTDASQEFIREVSRDVSRDISQNGSREASREYPHEPSHPSRNHSNPPTTPILISPPDAFLEPPSPRSPSKSPSRHSPRGHTQSKTKL